MSLPHMAPAENGESQQQATQPQNGHGNGNGNENTSGNANGTRASEQRSAARRRRASVRVACNTCRARKIARERELTNRQCSGDRPACGGCQRLKLPCQYCSTTAEQTPTMARDDHIDKLTKKLEDHEAVYRYLQYAPLEDALKLLAFIRTGAEFSVVVALVRGIAPPELIKPPE